MQFKLLQQKLDQQSSEASQYGGGSVGMVPISKLKEKDQYINELKQSHNEQLNMINHYKGLSEDKTKFSLEVVNKSMLAVDLIRKYREEGGGKKSHNSKKEIDDVEEKIIKCQEAI